MSGVGSGPTLATCETSQVLLAGVSGGFSRGSPIYYFCSSLCIRMAVIVQCINMWKVKSYRLLTHIMPKRKFDLNIK